MNQIKNIYIKRKLDIGSLAAKKSCFLFGPRQTGKSSLIRHSFPKAKVYNLLDNSLFLDFSHNPSKLREETAAGDFVIIDEIQRIPELLNEVHLLIEEKKSQIPFNRIKSA